MRWNAKIDTGGTPPRLRKFARQPQPLDDEIRQVAEEHSCDVDGIWWDRFNWFVQVSLIERDNGNARAALEELEAHDVTQELTTDEKQKRTGAKPKKRNRKAGDAD